MSLVNISKEGLKIKLFDTGVFVDNKYFDSYITLIYNNLTTKYEKYKTQRHHIIPRIYFKQQGIVDYMSWKKDSEVNIDNVINLTYINHIWAHYYLVLCVSDIALKDSLTLAFLKMIYWKQKTITQEELIELQHVEYFDQLYENYKTALHKKMKGKPKSDAHKQSLKKARDLHSTNKGKKAIFNKELNKVKYVLPEEVNQYLSDGWVLSGHPLSEETKHKISLANSSVLKGRKHNPVKKEGNIFSGLLGSSVLCIETGQIFNNVNEATEWLYNEKGIMGKIKDCCTGIREQTGGYHWKFIKVEGGESSQ